VTRVPGARDRLAAGSVLPVDTPRGPHLARLVTGRPVVHQALCPHRGAPLSEAYLVSGVLVCSWHRSVFQCDGGDRLYGPAPCGMRVLPAHFDGADLVIDDGAGAR
jgi:nitrite reductase/ring-hydroxylating ferredoxin subunit